MTTTVQIDFEALAEIGTRFQQQADTTQAILQALKQTFDPLQQGGWIGLGAAAYFDEMETSVLPAVERLVEALAMTGQVTTALTELIQTAEQEATAEVQKATGDGSGGSPTGGTPSANNTSPTTSRSGSIPAQPGLSDTTSFTPSGSGTNSASGNSVDSAMAPNLGQLRDQPTGSGSSMNNEPAAKIWSGQAGDTATVSPTETEGNGLGLAFGLAAASPFAALLGKTIKDRTSKDNT